MSEQDKQRRKKELIKSIAEELGYRKKVNPSERAYRNAFKPTRFGNGS